MTLPQKLLLSDLLRHRVRCDLGIDHGSGVTPWMHPPIHRLLGWATKPSSLRLARDVWRFMIPKLKEHYQAVSQVGNIPNYLKQEKKLYFNAMKPKATVVSSQ